MLTLHSLIFNGIDAIPIDVQIQAIGGLSEQNFNIVGLADRAVNESRERVRNALAAMNLCLPPKKITVNLAPADVEKSGAHFDLPILCGILCVMGILPADKLSKYVILGEIGLNGTLQKTSGILPASVWAAARDMGIVCPAGQGAEARWAGHANILAPGHILDLINHFKGTQILPVPDPANGFPHESFTKCGCMSEIHGQESAKRAIEIAAAGGHAMLMIGPPGSGKTMIASRLPGILPGLTPREILDCSMIYSVAGQLDGRSLISMRPFRAVHHTASAVALSGGGTDAKPGEISLAHNGILFLDELPEFQRQTLEILRQPMEQGKITISRTKRTATYPARFQLIAAMNPCPCGHLGNAAMSCSRAPRCAEAYQNKISGPLLDRIDLHVDIDPVTPWEMTRHNSGSGVLAGETSDTVRARVIAARDRALSRSREMFGREILNAHLDGKELDTATALDDDIAEFLNDAATTLGMSARGYQKIKRIALTIADLRGASGIEKSDVAEALSYRPIRRGKYGAG
ncbi:MAG: YifB family Mg chelatase-like AAA ATPase [Alphaproteobacteria bacterium]|nr:YifB family Mg chelatase-like AAA ATPase [Alphaproteobacteria bacterium]